MYFHLRPVNDSISAHAMSALFKQSAVLEQHAEGVSTISSPKLSETCVLTGRHCSIAPLLRVRCVQTITSARIFKPGSFPHQERVVRQIYALLGWRKSQMVSPQRS